MSTRAKKFIGEKYGRLTIIDRDGKFAICTCDCGSAKRSRVQLSGLKHGTTRSCGCARKKDVRDAVPVQIKEKVGSSAGRPRLTADEEEAAKRVKLKAVWYAMVNRCVKPSCNNFKKYGARGIKVCAEWQSFVGFYDWAIQNYSLGLSIDRINNEGNYEPDNCHWTTAKTQANNRRDTLLIYDWGQRTTLGNIVEKYALKYIVAYNKYQRILKTGRQPCAWDFNPKFPKRSKS